MYDVSNLYFFVPRKWLRVKSARDRFRSAGSWFLPKTARKTAQRFCVFFCVVICWGWGSVKMTCVFVVFDLLRWTHFMLGWTRLLYFGGHTLCYVGHVFCGREVEWMLQTPGFQQKERKTDLKNDENAGPISGPFGCFCFL
jgi:hypothetical protein